jgi:hypothetical protein
MEGGLFTKGKLIGLIVVLLLISVGTALYISFYTTPICNTFQCFQEHMTTCTKATYINEEPEASWQYTITGTGNSACQIDVTLLQAKKGPLELEKLNGYSMTCSYPLGVADYPEKNIDACSGKLKEEMQRVIIQKLYSYILSNLGKLDESLKSAL